MILKNKRDQDAWLREKTLESLKTNNFLQENDIIQVAETGKFYQVVSENTDIPLQNNLYAKNITNGSDKLSTPRNIALIGDVTGNADFDGSKDIIISATIIDDSHMHSNSTISSLDASKITSGIISIDRLPKGALERCTIVANDEERFKLTSEQVKQGDTIKVMSTNKMYFVIDINKLNSEEGYTIYTAGAASEVPWSGITGKPETFNPSLHIHLPNSIKQDINNRFVSDSEKNKWNNKADSSHGNHVPNIQTVDNKVFLRNDNTWARIIPDNIGAANAIHNHAAVQIIQDSNNRFVSDSEKNKWNNKANAHNHPYLSLSGGNLIGPVNSTSTITAEDFVTNNKYSVSDHENRLKQVEVKTNFEYLNQDNELDFSSGESFYLNKEEYSSLAKEAECFDVNSMNKIVNALETNQPISNKFNDNFLEHFLKIPNDKNSFVYQNQNYIFGNKIKKLRNMSNVKDIFASCHCSYVLTYDNELFSFGYGEHGQLGDGDNTDKNVIHKVRIPKKPIKQVSIEHGRNCMVLYEDDEIWVFGKNNSGCLGVGHDNVIKIPMKLNLSFNSKIKQICTKDVDVSYALSVILLENGELYVCGYNGRYELGLDHTTSFSYFVKNNFKFDSKPVKVAIGSMYNHTNLFVITENGSIYSTGYSGAGATITGENPNGQIAGFTKATLIPDGEKVIDFFTSSNDYVIVTDKATYFYGYNACCSLGLGHSKSVYTELIKSDFFSNKKIINFNANIEWDRYGNHYLSPMILTDDGCVYCSGRSSSLLNGIDNPNDIMYFRKMNIHGKRIISCKTGRTNRFFLTDEGEIYVTGENDDKESFLIPSNSGYIHLFNYDFNNKDMYVNKPYIKKEFLDESRCVEIYREEI